MYETLPAILMLTPSFEISLLGLREVTLVLLPYALAAVFACIACIPMYRTARVEAKLAEAQEGARALQSSIDQLSQELSNERIASEGLDDQITGYKKTMSELLSGIDVATAFFGADGRLMAWTDHFEDALKPVGGGLERGLGFETLLPVSQPFGHGEAVSGHEKDGYLDSISGDWRTALHQTPSGALLSARCRRVSQGWIVSLLDEGTAQELSTMQEQVAALREDLDRFLYMAGHDLRAPLRALKTLPEWIREEIEASFGPPDGELADYLNETVVQAERMDRLLLDILTYSRIGRLNTEIAEFDPETLVAKACNTTMPEGFALTLDGELPHVAASPWEFTLLMECLLSNAVKHHDKDRGQLRIKTQRGVEGVSILVEDDGPGIDPRFRDKIFEMFTTLKPRDEVEGSGIGLGMVRKIAGRWGATVSASDSELGGTCIRIDLPLGVERQQAAA